MKEKRSVTYLKTFVHGAAVSVDGIAPREYQPFTRSTGNPKDLQFCQIEMLIITIEEAGLPYETGTGQIKDEDKWVKT